VHQRSSPARIWLATALLVVGALGSEAAGGGDDGLSPFRPTVRFARLSIDDGLSQSVVLALVQDRRGFIWLGTQDGLNRWDGGELRIWRAGPHALPSSYVLSLLEDSLGMLWVGTQEGLVRFDPETEIMVTYGAAPDGAAGLPDAQVFGLAEGRGFVWAATDRGLARIPLSPAPPPLARVVAFREPILPHLRLWSILFDSTGALWIGARGNGGLLRAAPGFDPDRPIFEQLRHDPSDPRSLAADNVRALHEDPSGVLWVGTTAGVCRLDRGRSGFDCRGHDPLDPASLPHPKVWALASDPAGRLWVGTEAGLARSRADGGFDRFAARPRDPTSLPDGFVNSLLVDRGGVLWIGTDRGAARIDTVAKPFTHLFAGHQVWSALRDREGALWVGTSDGLWVERRGEGHRFAHDPLDSRSLPSDVVWCLLEDLSGTLWVGTSGGGLARRRGGGFEVFSNRPGDASSLASPRIIAIAEQDGQLWVGTSGGGLDRFDPATGRAEHFRHDPNDPASLANDSVTSLVVDRQGSLFVGTHAGLDRFDPGGRRFAHLSQRGGEEGALLAERVVCLREARDGSLLVGTAGRGLLRLEPDGTGLRSWGTRDGLPDDTIYAIGEDDQRRLWLSTNHGLARLDPGSGAVRVYTSADGLQANEFNFGSSFDDTDGRIGFGGVDGLSLVPPDLVRDSPYRPPVVLTGIRLLDREMDLARPLPFLDRIVLTPHDPAVTFRFAALAFANPARNRYAFKLEGFDSQWVDAGLRREATYTNLDPGEYVFRVRAANPDGVWNEEGASIGVVVLPPFWRTWWFSTLAAAALALLLWLGHATRMRLVEEHNRTLAALVAERTRDLERYSHELEGRTAELERANLRIQELDRVKSAFLAHMSHDIRTPLNSIIGFADLLAERAVGVLDARHRHFLDNISSAGRHLLGIINALLDLSKIESGMMQLEPEDVRVTALVEEIRAVMTGMAGRRGITIDIAVAPDLPRVRVDLQKTRQMLYNLLSNAVKFSPDGERVVVQARRVGGETSPLGVDSLELAVTDHGPGIAPADREAIFEEFRQLPGSTAGGTGLGLSIVRKLAELHGGRVLVESELGAGSTFRLFLPITPGARRSARPSPRCG